MTLSQCRECKKDVSRQAVSCPNCGAPRPSLREWKGYGYEWKSEMTLLGYPLVHIAVGRDEQGRLRVAKGIIAIGQFAIGLIAIAQFGVGILFGLGQFTFGAIAVAQCAVGVLFGLGQFATGYAAIGQLALGFYALGQVGFAMHLWTPESADREAVEFFQQLAKMLFGK